MKTKPCPECGKSLHAEAVKCSCGWQDARAAAKLTQANRLGCSAFACCLPGTIYESAQSTDGWCYIHAAHRESLDIQKLTRAINMRRKAYDAIHALYEGTSQFDWWFGIAGRFGRPFNDIGRADLLPTEEERKGTPQRWLGRVRRDLEAEVLGELGINIRKGVKKPERRGYAPTEEDIEAARLAEEAIANGSWKKPGDILEAA